MDAMNVLNAIGKQYPKYWKRIDELILEYKKDHQVPDWCHTPIAAVLEYMDIAYPKYTKYLDDSKWIAENMETYEILIQQPSFLICLHNWRISKGIYRIDENILSEILKTKLKSNLPKELFKHLPEWGIYIDTTNSQLIECDGFFVTLVDSNSIMELVFTTSTQNKVDALRLQLLNGGIRESVLDGLHRNKEVFENMDVDEVMAESDHIINLFTQLVNITLYLCSTNSDITHLNLPKRPTKPIPTIIKGKQKILAANDVTNWDVGYRVGADLRKKLGQVERAKRVSESMGNRVKPHTRSAHWHLYWTGSGRTTPTIKWVFMSTVNMDVEHESIPTEHNVK